MYVIRIEESDDFDIIDLVDWLNEYTDMTDEPVTLDFDWSVE